MANFKIEISECETVRTLVFRGNEYTTKMVMNGSGGMDGDISIVAQVEQVHTDISDDETLYEALDSLDFADEHEVREALETINMCEQ